MAANTDTRRRVKLYQLDEDGKWEDRGTGQVACLFVEVRVKWCIGIIVYVIIVFVCSVVFARPAHMITVIQYLLSLCIVYCMASTKYCPCKYIFHFRFDENDNTTLIIISSILLVVLFCTAL
jgi:hypothetical protein